MPFAEYFSCKGDPKMVIFLKLFAWLAVVGCIVGLVYTVLMLLPSESGVKGMKYHGIDQWGDNSLKWVSSDTDGFYAWKYAISILSALFSIVKTAYEFTESIFLANRISEAHRHAETDPHQKDHRDYYEGMSWKSLLGGMVLLLLLALTNAMPIYDVGFKTLMFGVKVAMFAISIAYVSKFIHPHGFPGFCRWTLNKFIFKSQPHGSHAGHSSKTGSHHNPEPAKTKGASNGSRGQWNDSALPHPTGSFKSIDDREAFHWDDDRVPTTSGSFKVIDAPKPEVESPAPANPGRASEDLAGSTSSDAPPCGSLSTKQADSFQPPELKLEGRDANVDSDQISYSQEDVGALQFWKEKNKLNNIRRLAEMDASSILSTLMVTVVSILVWYLFLRDPASQVKPRRRTTIIKKRPTFVKGKRRASRKPTLSTLRSESTLLN